MPSNEIEIKVNVDTIAALKDINEFRDQASHLRPIASPIANPIVGAVGGIGAGLSVFGGITGAIGSVKTGIEDIAGLGTKLKVFNDQTGISVESLSQFKFAFDQVGADFDALPSAILEMEKGMFGTEDQQEAFDGLLARMKIDPGDFEDIADPEEQMLKLFEELSKESRIDRNIIATGFFGDSALDLMPLINTKSKNNFSMLSEGSFLRGRADDLGLTLSRGEVENLASTDRKYGELDASARGLGQEFVTKLRSELQAPADFVTSGFNSVRLFEDETNSITDAIKGIIKNPTKGQAIFESAGIMFDLGAYFTKDKREEFDNWLNGDGESGNFLERGFIDFFGGLWRNARHPNSGFPKLNVDPEYNEELWPNVSGATFNRMNRSSEGTGDTGVDDEEVLTYPTPLLTDGLIGPLAIDFSALSDATIIQTDASLAAAEALKAIALADMAPKVDKPKGIDSGYSVDEQERVPLVIEDDASRLAADIESINKESGNVPGLSELNETEFGDITNLLATDLSALTEATVMQKDASLAAAEALKAIAIGVSDVSGIATLPVDPTAGQGGGGTPDTPSAKPQPTDPDLAKLWEQIVAEGGSAVSASEFERRRKATQKYGKDGGKVTFNGSDIILDGRKVGVQSAMEAAEGL